jgi:hypothetical protein
LRNAIENMVVMGEERRAIWFCPATGQRGPDTACA